MMFSCVAECSKNNVDKPVKTHDGAKEVSRSTMTVSFHTFKKARYDNLCFSDAGAGGFVLWRYPFRRRRP